jgi:hypothetical protein
MKYRTIEPSTVFPVDLEYVKSQLRITHAAHNAYIDSLIIASTDWASDFTGRQINFATLMAYCGYSYNRLLYIDRGPVISIVKVEYVNADATLVLIPTDKYVLSKDEYAAVIILKSDFEYINADTTRPDAIQITYTAGYGGESAGAMQFPELVKNAVALRAARFYTNPDDGVDEKVTVSENLLKSMRCPIV